MPIVKPRVSKTELQELLRLKGWSQAELARQLGVSEGAVTRWKSGENPPSGPSLRLLRIWLAEARLANAAPSPETVTSAT